MLNCCPATTLSTDWHSWVPFNSGFFAVERGALDCERLLSLFQSARSFHEKMNPERKLTISRKGLFMSDQGFLNYFLARSGSALSI